MQHGGLALMPGSGPIQLVPDATAFKPSETSTVLYRFRKISPDAAPTAALAATCQAVFRIPSTYVINLKKSRLHFELVLPAQAATFFSFMHMDRVGIQAIRLETETGVLLVDINPFLAFQKLVYPQVLTKEKYFQLSEGASITTPYNCPQTAAAAQPQAHMVRWNNTNAANWVENGLDVPSSQNAVQDYECPQFLAISQTANLAQGHMYDIPLGDLVPHSVLNTQQDLWWGQGLILTVTFCQTTDLGFKGTASGDITAGTAALTVAHTLADVSLYVACQDQPPIAAAIRNEVLTSGISLPTQYPLVIQDSLATATANYSRILHLNQGRGGSLLRVYFGVSSQVTTGYNAFNFNSLRTAGVPIPGDGATRWTTYRSFINSAPTSDYALTPFEVWQLSRGNLKDTVASDFLQWQQFGAIVVQDFSGLPGTGLVDQTPLGGLSLALAVDWQVDLVVPTTATYLQAKNIYWAFIFSRMLRINASGVTLNSV